MRRRPRPPRRPTLASKAWIAGVALAGFGIAAPAAAQRLQIGAPTAVPTAGTLPLIWGRVLPDAVYVGGERHRREALPAPETGALRSVAPPPAPPLPVAPPPAAPSLKARFALRASEQRSCTGSVRYAAFQALVQSLRPRVESVTWRAGAGWEACAAAVDKALARLGLRLTRDDESGDGAELILVFSPPPAPTPPAPAGPAPQPKAVAASPAARPAAAGPVRVTVSGRAAVLGDDGWFVFLADSYAKVSLSVEQSGYQPLQRDVMPWPVPVGRAPPPSGAGAADLGEVAEVELGEAPTLRIAYLATPPAAQRLELDLISGLGLGYGRNLPGEVRGQRLAVAAALARRDVVAGFGARAGLSLTQASRSAVPWTLIADGTATRTGELGAGSGVWRLGLGARLFQSGVQAKAERDQTQVPSVVLSPLADLAAEQTYGSALLGAHLSWTPLYVPGAGLHQSLNPGVELGWRVAPNYTVTVEAGSETIKYPTATRETSLTLDLVSLGLKAGL